MLYLYVSSRILVVNFLDKLAVVISSIGGSLVVNKEDVIGGHVVDLVTIYSISFAYKD